MIPPRPVYTARMEPTEHTHVQRVIAILQARQHLVFYAIILTTLGGSVPLLSAWLVEQRPLAVLLSEAGTPLFDAVTAPSLWTIGLLVADLLVITWLRAGYIRSLAGRFSLAPRNAGQFLRLLGLQVILTIIPTAGLGLVDLASPDTSARSILAGAATMLLLIISVAVLYSDYVVVLADTGPLQALKVSARIAMQALVPSVLIVFLLSPLSQYGALLPNESISGSLARALPMLVLRNVVVGALVFVADVVLLAIFLDTVERHAREAEGGD